MSTLCRFVLPSTLSTIEDACVAEFNEYKKRMKESSHGKSSNKRFAGTAGGLTTNPSSVHDPSHQHQREPIRNPEQAKEAAKKLVQSGLIKVQSQSKDQGFKRATSVNAGQDRLVKKINVTPSTASPSISNPTNPFQSVSFVSPTSTPKFVNTNSHENKRRVVNYDDTDNY